MIKQVHNAIQRIIRSEAGIYFTHCPLIKYYVDRVFFFFSSRRRHTRFDCDWSSDVCSSDLTEAKLVITADGGWRGGHAVELKAAADQALASGCKSVRRVIVLKRTGQPISMDPSRDLDRKSTRLNSSHSQISYAVFCLKKKKP